MGAAESMEGSNKVVGEDPATNTINNVGKYHSVASSVTGLIEEVKTRESLACGVSTSKDNKLTKNTSNMTFDDDKTNCDTQNSIFNVENKNLNEIKGNSDRQGGQNFNGENENSNSAAVPVREEEEDETTNDVDAPKSRKKRNIITAPLKAGYRADSNGKIRPVL